MGAAHVNVNSNPSGGGVTPAPEMTSTTVDGASNSIKQESGKRECSSVTMSFCVECDVILSYDIILCAVR